MKKCLLLPLITMLPGCIAVWGASYNIALSNSRSVVVEYDQAVINLSAMLQAVQSECNKYGKDAVLDGTSQGNLGILVNTYRCETRKADHVIDVQN